MNFFHFTRTIWLKSRFLNCIKPQKTSWLVFLFLLQPKNKPFVFGARWREKRKQTTKKIYPLEIHNVNTFYFPPLLIVLSNIDRLIRRYIIPIAVCLPHRSLSPFQFTSLPPIITPRIVIELWQYFSVVSRDLHTAAIIRAKERW